MMFRLRAQLDLEINALEEVFLRWMMNFTKPAQARRLDSSNTSVAFRLHSQRVHIYNY